MGGFLDIRFPINISYGSSGGPGYNTSIIEVMSGKEKRNSNWDYPRCEYNAAFGIRQFNDLEALIEMFHIAKGRGYSFRYKDHLDFKSCAIADNSHSSDQIIGVGDGATTEFQIYKTYQKTSISGSIIYSQTRKITKIVENTCAVGLDGVAQPSGFTVDLTTGIVSFDTAPVDSIPITCGYEFDVHVRFDTDQISASLDDYKSGSIDVPVIEEK